MWYVPAITALLLALTLVRIVFFSRMICLFVALSLILAFGSMLMFNAVAGIFVNNALKTGLFFSAVYSVCNPAAGSQGHRGVRPCCDLHVRAIPEKTTSSVEVRERIEAILKKYREGVPDSARLREIRSLEVLEWIGNEDAKRLLEKLSKGAANAALTLDAKAVLARLRR
jgi:hypothetical protein